MLTPTFTKGSYASSPQNNGLTGGTELKTGHEGNRCVSVWLTSEQYERLEEFLDKFSTGQSFSIQFRDFLVWTINQKEGINAAVIVQRLEEVRKKQKKFIV